ncbi:MAG TPA: polysaccharide biosynthesis tyrosine autokinase [Pyrinomonadaceae bacterium]|nr:polysaccharide biosynthesis tyrosine autokinase [Chloracidobacterium sp.]MBL0241335.1 polysaccharide biosynthesis tyrosine autokinase [Chloracidobacterium sp.]MBP9935398.1 polysaccharide biosynthesis tyrosine autokinase [Pyrinomonadaceae bacterium]HQY67526.1 polysaccharide biosynthesis tyrosine autokinase [Pyrinomonadaceae bacterium]HRA39099.1 polysaccharide biosynthesis tyrosine autokinase [Pyrinomonadaceae bacterium]
MEQDQRLTPLPKSVEMQAGNQDYPPSYSSYYDDESFANKRSIRQYFNIVKKRLPIIVAIAIIVTAAVSFYSFRQPSIYQANTEMIIEPRKPQVTQKEAININFGNDSNYYNTQLQLLQNPDLMKKVVIALGLQRDAKLLGDENRGFLAGIRSIFSGDPKKADAEAALPIISDSTTQPASGKIILTPEEDALAARYVANLTGARLKVDRLTDTNLVTVSVQNENPVLVAKVADKLAEIFIEEDAKRELEGAQTAYDELTKSIEDLKNTIARQESEYIDEMRSSDLPLQEKGGELRAGNLQTLQAQYNDALSETGKIQALYSAAVTAGQKGDILSVVGDNKALQDARSQNLKRQADLEKRIEDIDKKIDEKAQRRKELLAKYTEEFSSVKAVDAEIGELKLQRERVQKEVTDKIKNEGTKLVKDAEREVLATLKAQFDAARQREDRARGAYMKAAEDANFEGQAETRLITKKREIETNRSLLDTYTQRQKEQELAIAGGKPNNIKISNRAVSPGGLVGPNRTRNILVALLVSLAAGIGLAFLLDYLDDSVKTSDDVSRSLGLPTLALIPHHSQGEKRRIPLPGLGARNDESISPQAALITLEERNSPTAEAYRHLRTSLLFSSAGKPPQTILVTSSQPSEGKTTTAINTAITLAQSDVDVIIIDCDLRRPRLHSHFGLDNNQGLTNYLSGEKSTENLIKSAPGLPRLKIITSGPIPPNPAELLSSNEMKNLIQFLKGRFKHVVIDSPPAISFTDAAILSTLVDGVVLVAMAGRSSIHLMRQFKQRLGNIGARIYGVVLNGIKSGSMEYDYYGNGYYDYYRRSETDETPLMEDTAKQNADD